VEIKLFEVRDEGTYLPCIAIRCDPANEAELYMLARAGYGTNAHQQAQHVLFAPESDPHLQYDPASWGDRTRQTAHRFIRADWDALQTGDVIDVRVCLGETDTPAAPEREADPLNA
jgi:hypothetical protein